MGKKGYVVAGAGRIGSQYIEILSSGLPGAVLKGCYVQDKAEKERVKQTYGCHVFNDENEYLGSPDVDAVIIATPSYTHEEMAHKTLDAGKHILLEKPLALSLQAAQNIVEKARIANLLLMPSFPERFNPVYQRAKALIKDGVLGEIISLNCKRHTKSNHRPEWYWRNEKSGGVIWDLACHDMDLCRWLLEQEAESIAAIGKTVTRDSDALDNAFIHIVFERGPIASLDASWILPPSFPAWGDVRMDILGEDGLLTVDTGLSQPIHICGKGGSLSFIHRVEYDRWQAVDVNRDGYLAAMLSAFDAAVSGTQPLPVTGNDGLKVVELADAAHKALAEKRTVAIKTQ